jgi:hypothetical protein
MMVKTFMYAAIILNYNKVMQIILASNRVATIVNH